MGFLVTPLVFVFITVIFLLVLLQALIGDVIGYAGMLFLDNPPVLSDELNNIFVPPSDDRIGVKLSDIEFPSYETIYGQIEIESVNINIPLVYGDSDKALQGGAGQYIGSFIIGYGGTTLIAGHNISRQFGRLPGVSIGDIIKITTSYGVFRYRVADTAVKTDSDTSAYDLNRADENVVLYTCYYERTPVGSIKKRFYVYGEFLSGPMLEKN